jgi:23S rRNA pseudouridine955/2504/2580 synthase
MNQLRKEPRISAAAASWAEVDEEEAGQRIDNFLIRLQKGVPRATSTLLRTGQVPVNSRRIEATYRQRGDQVRLPPVRSRGAGVRALLRLVSAELRLSHSHAAGR